MSKLHHRVVGRRPLSVERVPRSNQSGPCSPGAVMESTLLIDQVDIVWTHDDGFPPDTMEVPIRLSHAGLVLDQTLGPALKYGIIAPEQAEQLRFFLAAALKVSERETDLGIFTVETETRTEIKDQLNVAAGTSEEGLEFLISERARQLARALRIEP